MNANFAIESTFGVTMQEETLHKQHKLAINDR